LFAPCHFERAAVGLFLRRLPKRLRTFFTEAKENKYPLGKSASDERYSFVGMRSLLGEAICTQLIILQPRRHDRTSGAHHQLISTPANLLIILSASLSPYQKTPSRYNQSPSPARRKCRLAGQRRQAFHSSRFHYWESCTLVAPSGCRS
jgi:hypothetical protein